MNNSSDQIQYQNSDWEESIMDNSLRDERAPQETKYMKDYMPITNMKEIHKEIITSKSLKPHFKHSKDWAHIFLTP